MEDGMITSRKGIRIKYKSSWLFLVLLAVVYFLTLCQGDLSVTFTRAMAFDEALFSGDFPAGYDFESSFYIPVHILFGIWGLPCWLLIHFGAATASSVVCLLWAKLLCVITYLGCILCIGVILQRMKVSHIEFWLFILASVFIMFSPALVTGSYDFVEVLFGLAALLLAADEDRLGLKTLVLLSLSVSFKALFLLAAVIIILLKEKRILHLAKDAVVLLSLPFVFRIFSKWCANTVPSTKLDELVNHLQNRFLENTVSVGVMGASLFVIAVLAIFAVAYLSPRTMTKRQFLLHAAWLGFAVYFSMFIFVYSHPQWTVFLAPFLIVIAAANEDRLKDSVIFVMIFDLALTFMEVTTFIYSFLRDGVFDYLILKDIPVIENTSCFYDILDKHGLIQYLPAMDALFVVSGVVILAINNPWKPLHAENALTPVEERTCFTWARVYRLGFILAYFALNLYINYCI